MLVYIRADASIHIGAASVLRCLTLAEHLRRNRIRVRFVCRDLTGNLIDYVKSKDYEVIVLPQVGNSDTFLGTETFVRESRLEVPWFIDAEQTIELLQDEASSVDWFIIDHYALDHRYETSIQPYVNKIMVINELADRRHQCDLLLDFNYYEDMSLRYDGLVPESCVTLLGPKYAILGTEMIDHSYLLKPYDGSIQRIAIVFGSLDQAGETVKALRALLPVVMEKKELQVNVHLGKYNPYAEQVKELCWQMPDCRYYGHLGGIMEFTARPDLTISSVGMEMWDSCVMGIPNIAIAASHHQHNMAEHTAAAGAIYYLGMSNEVTSTSIQKHLMILMNNPLECLRISKNAMKLVDGLGAERIYKELTTATPSWKMTRPSRLTAYSP